MKKTHIIPAIFTILFISGLFFKGWLPGFISGLSLCLLIVVTIGKWATNRALKRMEQNARAAGRVEQLLKKKS